MEQNKEFFYLILECSKINPSYIKGHILKKKPRIFNQIRDAIDDFKDHSGILSENPKLYVFTLTSTENNFAINYNSSENSQEDFKKINTKYYNLSFN